MSEVGIRALKQNASAVVAEAAAGESVTITDRGRPVAQLVPLGSTKMANLTAASRIRPARRHLSELNPPVRRRPGDPRLSDELDEMRRAERY